MFKLYPGQQPCHLARGVEAHCVQNESQALSNPDWQSFPNAKMITAPFTDFTPLKAECECPAFLARFGAVGRKELELTL